VTWSSSALSDVVVERSGTAGVCDAIVQFGNTTGPRTIRIDATNGVNTKSAFKPITVFGTTGPSARIISPPQGCARTFDQNATVPLRASAVDPNGQALTFTWEDLRVIPSTPIPVGSGPSLSWGGPHQQGDSTLRLTVTNAVGARSVVTTPLFFAIQN